MTVVRKFIPFMASQSTLILPLFKYSDIKFSKLIYFLNLVLRRLWNKKKVQGAMPILFERLDLFKEKTILPF